MRKFDCEKQLLALPDFIFYVYGIQDFIFGIHGYVKKTQDIPEREKEYARKVLRQLINGGLVK